MKRISILFSILLIFTLSLNTYAQSWTLYKGRDGVDVNKSNGGSDSESSDDGGGSVSSGGTQVSAEDEATHDAQQDIRKDVRNIIERIKNSNFVNIQNNGQNSIYAGKGKLTNSEMKQIINQLGNYQKYKNKANSWGDFNGNDLPRSMEGMTPPNMSPAEKKKAQNEIVKKEKIKTKGGSSSKKGSNVTPAGSNKVNLNSPVNTRSYDPPGAKSGTYVDDLINGGVRDFDAWDDRYETLKNYYNSLQNNNGNMEGTGTNSNVNAYKFLGYMVNYSNYIKKHHNYFTFGVDPTVRTFDNAKSRINHKRTVKLQSYVPACWALNEVGIANYIHASGGSFKEQYTGTITKYMKRIKSNTILGRSVRQACIMGVLRPGDIITLSNNHVFVYTGQGYDMFDAGNICGDYSKGIRFNYSNYPAYCNSKITDILRWNEMDKDRNKINQYEKEHDRNIDDLAKRFNSVVPYPATNLPSGNPAISIEEFEDVAYVESYYLTQINRNYYEVKDYRSDRKKYELYNDKGKIIKKGEVVGNELNFDDVKEPGKYKLKWWQWATVVRGISVGYLKRQYLVLLPSNTILYYKEAYMEESPVFIQREEHDEWVPVDTQTQVIKDLNEVDTGGSIIERTE